MLICPQCDYENPKNNKFCERCGTSLIQKACHECGESVPYTEENCPHCGAFTAKVWWSIITIDKNQESEELEEEKALEEINDNEKVENVETVAEEETTAEETIPEETIPEETIPEETIPEETTDNDEVEAEIKGNILTESKYLDPQQRYRVLASDQASLEEALKNTNSDLLYTVKIVDEKPLQQPLITSVFEEKQEEILSHLEEIDKKSLLKSPFWSEVGIPAIAMPYFVLQEWYPMIPEIQDAWCKEAYNIILLEDRSQWKLLKELWNDEEIPPNQILYWLDEMAGLWQELEKVNCSQSILEINNLRIDEDETLCLQQLYPNSSDGELDLKDLIKVWQLLFNESGRTYQGELLEIFEEVNQGTLTEIEELKDKILNIIKTQYELEKQQSPSDTETEEISPELMPTEQMFYNSPGDDQPTVVLPMQLLSLTDAGCTDIGRQRDHNEDYYGIQTEIRVSENVLGKTMQAKGIYLVCDGMGGHAAGEVASAMATETLQIYFKEKWQDELPDYETILEGIHLANNTLYEINMKNARTGSGRMGTTLVMALIQDNKVAIAHVGDSRIYRITRKCGLEQLTADHEVGQREIQRGVEPEIAYSRQDAYQLTQALGPRDNQFVKPDIDFFEVNEDTVLLLCSDGLSDNNLLENHWENYLIPLLSSRTNIDQALSKLIEFANEHNGHDNITGLVTRIKVRPILDQNQSII
jgi:protein phosphatase